MIQVDPGFTCPNHHHESNRNPIPRFTFAHPTQLSRKLSGGRCYEYSSRKMPLTRLLKLPTCSSSPRKSSSSTSLALGLVTSSLSLTPLLSHTVSVAVPLPRWK